MSDVLTKICDDKRDHVAACKARTTLGSLEAAANEQSAPRGFIKALETSVADGRYGLIAEIKRHPRQRDLFAPISIRQNCARPIRRAVPAACRF